MANFSNLKVGDYVDRHHGSGYFMTMKVEEIHDTYIVCSAVKNNPEGQEIETFKGGWTFDIATGAEIDDDLQWGPKYGKTGTRLVHG